MLSIEDVKFHERIAQCRADVRLTQAALAKKCRVSPAAVGQWETGDTYPDVGRLPRLAAIFGVTVDDLIQGDAHYQAIRDALGLAS